MTQERQTVLQGGRAKAYRPLDEPARRAAFLAGIAAYRRGEFFEAHELLEPAWMGTRDATERDLHQGLIKLAAGYVHAVRDNPQGMMKNLRGARERLAAVVATGLPPLAMPRDGSPDLDLPALVASIDRRLANLARTASIGRIDPPRLERTKG